MRIPVVIEWVGGAVGWKATATLRDGTEIAVHKAHNLLAARRRIRRGILVAGVAKPELVESLRLPKILADELETFRELRAQTDRITSDMVRRRTELAQRLLAELHLSEREVADWVGISGTHLANLLQAHTTGTSEITVTPPEKGRRRSRSA